MALSFGILVLRKPRTQFPRIRLALLLALGMTLAWRVPLATSADASGRNIWSIQLDGGMFVPLASKGASPMIGMRYCKHYSSHLYGGLLTGVGSVSRSQEQPALGSPGAGSTVETARANARLVPVMGFLQVNLTDKFPLVPLVGFGAGYEWLSLTGTETRAIYSNFAWQAYTGVALRVATGVRVNGEVFYNGGSLERHVTKNDEIWLEAVHVNGIGLRVGLDMDFE
jgi:hypothetical protein